MTPATVLLTCIVVPSLAADQCGISGARDVVQGLGIFEGSLRSFGRSPMRVDGARFVTFYYERRGKVEKRSLRCQYRSVMWNGGVQAMYTLETAT